WRVRALYFLVVLLMILALGYFLKFAGPHLTDFFYYMHFRVQPDYANEVQLWLDATTTILFLVAMFVSTKAYVEQWYLWLVINVLSILMWRMSSTDTSFMMVAKYSVYFVNTFYGIYTWNKLSKA
ncbi:MAG: nicotinamide riboside transporter PnuC, partial [Prevotella sp.]|nr:nicotinamide riboside transporter PnuC [Prevotella sp.]